MTGVLILNGKKEKESETMERLRKSVRVRGGALRQGEDRDNNKTDH